MPEELTNKPTRLAKHIGKYEILSHVATGGMGVVYKARDTDLDRLVALKILPADLAKNQMTLIRFKREAAAAAQLRHENIVMIFDIGEWNGTYYIAFEFVEGTDLQDYINRQCKLDAKDARQIMIQATKALVHAHEQHVVHRDIKPSNFLLTLKDGRLIVKLSDFGLAIRQEDSAEFRLTKDKSTVGTVDYMSPEQATDSRAVDIRSDIYSLGCTFFHMLAGEAPFSKGSLPERIVQHMQNAPPDLRSLNKHVPKSFAAIINRMLAKKPADRYQTPTELLKDLEHPDRVVRSRPREAQLERHDQKKDGARTDEFDAAQPSVAKDSPSPRSSADPRAAAASEKGKRRVVMPDPGVESDDAAPVKEQLRAKKAAPGPAPSAESDDAVPIKAQPRVKKATPRPELDDDPGDETTLEKAQPRRKKGTPHPEAKAEHDEYLPLDLVAFEMSPEEAARRRPALPEVGAEPVDLVPLKVAPADMKAPIRDEPADFTPFQVAEAPVRPRMSEASARPKRRTDTALKAHVAPAAATRRREETEEIDTPPLEKPKRKSSGANSPWWLYGAAGSAVLLGVILVFAIATSTRPTTQAKKKDPPPPVVIDPRPIEVTPVEVVDSSAHKMAVPMPELPMIDPAFAKVDRTDLRKDNVGKFTTFPGVPEPVKTLRVSRLAQAGPTVFRSLAEAAAQTKPDEWALIEIADNGPIYVSALPALASRRIVLRGAAGFHPLLAWEIPKKPAAAQTPRTLLSIAQGTLIVENLDFVLKGTDDAPTTLFDVGAADFYCRNCSFSLIGKAQEAITLVRRVGVPDDAIQKKPSQTWLKRCYVRGPEISLLSVNEASTDLLVEESLIVGQQQPLIQVRGSDDDAFGLYCVRSTLVTSQVLLRWQAPEGKRASPRIQGRALDSILSRDDAKAPQGDMIHLVEDAGLKNVTWRATNCVYAGWKRLLASVQKNIASNELDLWQQQWDYKGPDRSLADTWPSGPPSALETQPASTFLPAGPVAFETAVGTGALGAVIGWLPGEPEAWMERAYEPSPTPALPPRPTLFPVIDEVNDGLYHGERLDLNRVDLGKHLQMRLQQFKPARQIVLYLSGAGVCKTSSVRIRDVEHLILFFISNTLSLELNPAAIAQQSPIIDMAGGHLELIGARVNVSPITLVPHVLSLQNAHLTLTSCRLQGPWFKSNDSFNSLIAIGNSNETPTTLLMRDSVLWSSKTLIQMRDNVQLKSENCVFLSLADGVQFDADGPIHALTHIVEHNTFAVRHAVFNVRQGKDFEAAGNVGLFASSNAFLRPFAEDFDRAALLRGAESWASQGRWRWQGRNNVYDARPFAFFAAAGKLPAERQTLKDWQQAWGPAAERESLHYEGAPAKLLITLDTILPFDRLALPPQLRGDPSQAPPGANLVGLGLVKKKG